MIVGRDSAVVQSDVSESQAIPYSLAGGALLDFSIKGAMCTIHGKAHHGGWSQAAAGGLLDTCSTWLQAGGCR